MYPYLFDVSATVAGTADKYSTTARTNAEYPIVELWSLLILSKYPRLGQSTCPVKLALAELLDCGQFSDVACPNGRLCSSSRDKVWPGGNGHHADG